jgi:dienelactone hydrolase
MNANPLRRRCTPGWVTLLLSWTVLGWAEGIGTLPPAGDTGEDQQATVACYDVFEVALTSSRTYANPFLDVSLKATFTAPSGRTLTAYGFYDGGSTWRVRLAPDEVGEWRYVTQAGDPADDGLHHRSGTFRCVRSSNKGFIRVDPKRRYRFACSDGTPFFTLGDTCSVTCKALSDANRRAYLDARAGKPFNFLRLFTSLTFNAWTAKPWSEAIARDADGFPWGGTPQAPDYDRLNPAYFQRYEKILGELRQRDVYAEIIVFNLYEVPFKDPAIWTPAREELWGRYVVSRLSALRTVFLWTVAQEYERHPAGRYSYEPADDDWVKRMAKLIRAADPHGHPVTVHPWGKDPQDREDLMEAGVIGARFGSGPELDVLSHQHNSYGTATWVSSPAPGYWDGPAAGVEKALWADRRYDKPIINTEYGYEWLADGDVNFNRQTHGTDKCRRAAWRIFTAGGAGLAAGFRGTTLGMDKAEIYYDNQQRFASFQVADSGHAKQLQHLYDFVTLRTGFRDLNPAQMLVGPPNLCLASPGREYVVYAPAGGALSLDLTGTAGSFSVGWLNPRTGAYEGRAWVEGGTKRVFTSPDHIGRVEGASPSNRGQDARDTGDWVLHLKKVDDRVQAGWQQRLARAARSPESWRARREEIRRQILVAAGLWPEFERPPVKAVVTGQLERDGYIVKKVYLETWPGFYLTGLLYLPKKPGPLPAVLCTHGHGRNGRFGPDEEQPRALTLARLGFVVFAYDMIGYGECTQLPHEFADPPWGLNLLGLQLWDSLCVVDFVSSLPEVDPKRIGVTGSSGGGTQTFLLTAVDDRIACAAPVCMVAAEFQGGCSCENAPGLRIGLNNVEIAAAAAPRPLLLVSATGDWTKYTPVLEGPAIHSVYEALGVDDHFRCVQFVAPHNYNRGSREAVYPWFAHWLGNAPMAERLAELPLKAEPRESLEVFTTARPRPQDAVDAAGLDALLQERIRRQLDALWPRDAASWERFRRIMAPALRCMLATEWPRSDEMEATQAPATTRSFATISIHLRGRPAEIELLASATTDKKRLASLLVTSTAQEVESVVQELRPVGGVPAGAPEENASRRHYQPAVFVLPLQPHERETASGGNEEQRHQYVSTYYRTALAWQVQDVLTALAYLTGQAGFREVRLAGLGAAGAPVLLARALEPTGKVSLTIADLGGLDDDEATWTDAQAQPGMLRLGGLRTAAILAAPSQLVLHYAGAHFDAAAPRTAYQAIGVAPSLEISESPWNVGTVLERLGASDRPDRKGKESEN